jgi:midasin (ATPase involved in ribosome maturation)
VKTCFFKPVLFKFNLYRYISEQLRLILEPTLASRLQGDFRTGKRLNMRKIIPYIASDFRKDKIWLRRSRPSQRKYQVVLAIGGAVQVELSCIA